jgi:hypothetical protein
MMVILVRVFPLGFFSSPHLSSADSWMLLLEAGLEVGRDDMVV